jgi:hypothetical protein
VSHGEAKARGRPAAYGSRGSVIAGV